MITVRPADARGRADHGWLDTRHTFSFADYYDPRFMGFGPLRVINEDRVAAGRGFGAHPHRDMEIISYVVEGALAHRDTLGVGSVIRPGEVQLMSAGRGIAHSEMNASAEAPVHFLQIWLLPTERGTPPRYDQADFGHAPGVRLVVSPEGRDGSLRIGQDADVHRVLLPAGEAAELALRRARAWVQVIRGPLDLDGTLLHPGDGAALTDHPVLRLTAAQDVEALVFDLP